MFYREFISLFLFILVIMVQIPSNKLLQTLSDGCLGVKSKLFFGLGNVCLGDRDITWLHRHNVNVGLDAQQLLNHVNEFFQCCQVALTQVVDLVARVVRVAVNSTNNTADNVVDEGVISFGGSISKLLDGLSSFDVVDEGEDSHIGPSSWSVNCKETKTRHREFVEMVVGVAQQLPGFFSGSVGTDRVVNVVSLSEWRVGAVTIHRGRGSKNEVFDFEFLSHFEHGHCSSQVRVTVQKRLFD
mmetsp:Transcript_8526/g.12919  ORF Transcript_8526/g.12919 Transcript_8526/m.12919 type:complete len:242 (+) Transcript_8526:69-794(+)